MMYIHHNLGKTNAKHKNLNKTNLVLVLGLVFKLYIVGE